MSNYNCLVLLACSDYNWLGSKSENSAVDKLQSACYLLSTSKPKCCIVLLDTSSFLPEPSVLIT